VRRQGAELKAAIAGFGVCFAAALQLLNNVQALQQQAATANLPDALITKTTIFSNEAI
jgi:hypothetical protein